MTSALDRLRALSLALPETWEKVSHGEPTFWVHKRMFAMFASAANHHGAGRDAVWCKAVHLTQEMVVSRWPDRYFVPPYVGVSGWFGIYLDRRPNWREVADRLEGSYRLVAPRRLLTALDGETTETPTDTRRACPLADGEDRMSVESKISVEYKSGDAALSVDAFIALARRIWQRDYDTQKTADALKSTINIGAWNGSRLVGSVRVLTDGYFFSTVPEVMVDPEFRKHGIGRELLRRALEATPGGVLYLGAQPGNERFFELAGFRRGPTGYVGRRR